MAAKSESRWHRQESRAVRPFRFAEDYLKDVALRLYADEEFKINESFQVAATVEVDRLGIAVKVPQVPKNLQESIGIAPNALRLVVTLEDRVFKNTAVALNIPLSELSSAGRILDVGDHAKLMSWAGETRVHVAVVLSEPRTGEVGTAQRVGSWVARKTFVVATPRDTASFPINAVEPEYFRERGLPSATTYLVEISDPDLNQGCENLPDLVKVSLAKDVHAALARDEDSAMGRALIKSIYIDVVTTVLATGYANLGAGTEVVQGSIIDVVTSKLAKSTGVSKDRLRDFAAQLAGSQLRAVVQAETDLSRALVSAAQRRQA